jgi:hypothetical protein
MTRSVLSAFALLAVVSSFGCDKKEEGGKATAASASASTPAAKAASGGSAADDPVVCCKFGGVKGSSTKKACETGKGEVVADSECPTLKK